MTIDIIEDDGPVWIRDNPGVGAVVTSIPDPQNMIGVEGDEWAAFHDFAVDVLEATASGSPTVFRQTDRRDNGTRSKAEIVLRAARSTDRRLLWHKISLQQAPETTNLRRPTYAHILAFGDDDVRPGNRWPDVFPAGRKLYANGMGLAATERVIRWASNYATTIVDPFCGHGTVPAMADALGYNGIGIDADPDQVATARSLSLRRGSGLHV